MPAYDTVLIKSPGLDAEQVKCLMEFCDRIQRMCIGTGEVKTTFTTGLLDGSYDYRIRIALDNTDWVKPDGYQTPIKIQSDWYVKIECSIHKLLCSHNVFGGPQDIKKSIAYLVNHIEKCTGVELPVYLGWYPERIDVAKIFVFKTEQIVKRIIENLKKGVYSRRKLHPYEGGGVSASGSTSTVKFYPKGNEFEVHDYKRFNKYIAVQSDRAAGKDNGDLVINKMKLFKAKIDKILEKAKRTVRFETEIKLRKLKELFENEAPTVGMLDDEKLFKFMNDELRKCIREREDMEIVRRSDLVEERLDTIYGVNLGKALYAMWALMVQNGEKYIKTKMKNQRATFYSHRKKLVDAGVSWVMSNINLKYVSIVPEDFTFLNEKYVDDSIDPEVIRKLAEVA